MDDEHKTFWFTAILVFVFLMTIVASFTYGSRTEQQFRMKCLEMRGSYETLPGMQSTMTCKLN